MFLLLKHVRKKDDIFCFKINLLNRLALYICAFFYFILSFLKKRTFIDPNVQNGKKVIFTIIENHLKLDAILLNLHDH